MSSSVGINLLLVVGLTTISSFALISTSSATGQLQDSVKSLVHDPFRALDKELTRLTGSNELEDNRAAARRILGHKSVDQRHKSTFEHLAELLVELRGYEEHNTEELCSARNLANLTSLVAAMAKSSKRPTQEPDSRRRLNLLLVKQTNSVRSFCYEHLSKKWDAQLTSFDILTFSDPCLAPLDSVPFTYLFRDELKRHKHQSGSSKHTDLVPLIEHLQHLQVGSKQSSPNEVEERTTRQDQILLDNLVKPCQRLTRSHLARDILQPRVDLTTIELVVYHQVDMAHRDYSSHFIAPLARFIMCQKLLAPASPTRRRLLSELYKLDREREGRKRRKQSRRMNDKVFSSSES